MSIYLKMFFIGLLNVAISSCQAQDKCLDNIKRSAIRINMSMPFPAVNDDTDFVVNFENNVDIFYFKHTKVFKFNLFDDRDNNDSVSTTILHEYFVIKNDNKKGVYIDWKNRMKVYSTDSLLKEKASFYNYDSFQAIQDSITDAGTVFIGDTLINSYTFKNPTMLHWDTVKVFLLSKWKDEPLSLSRMLDKQLQSKVFRIQFISNPYYDVEAKHEIIRRVAYWEMQPLESFDCDLIKKYIEMASTINTTSHH